MMDPIDELQEALEANLKEVSTGPGAQQGLVVTHIVRGGRGEKSRYKNGDIIVSVDKKSIRSFDAFDEVIRTKHKEIFAEGNSKDRLHSSTYLLELEVRTEG